MERTDLASVLSILFAPQIFVADLLYWNFFPSQAICESTLLKISFFEGAICREP